MITRNINEIIHVRDNWTSIAVPAAGLSESIDETIHLRDGQVRDIDGTHHYTEYINEIVTHYKRAIEIDSTYLTCYSNLGSAYIDLLKDNKFGLLYSKKAAELSPVEALRWI